MEAAKKVQKAIEQFDSDLYRFTNLCTTFRYAALSMRKNQDPNNAPSWGGLIEILRKNITSPIEISANNIMKEITSTQEMAKTEIDEALEKCGWLRGWVNTIKNLLVFFDMAATDEDERRFAEKADWESAFATLLDIAKKTEMLSEDIWQLAMAKKDQTIDKEQPINAVQTD